MAICRKSSGNTEPRPHPSMNTPDVKPPQNSELELRLRVGAGRITHACYAVRDFNHAATLATALLESLKIEAPETSFRLFDLEVNTYGFWSTWHDDDLNSFYSLMTKGNNVIADMP